MKLVLNFLIIIVIIGCSNPHKPSRKFANKGMVAIANGKDEMDSLKYSCDSCYEILQDKSVFDTLITIASNEAKERLRNKLSFRPRSVEMNIWRADSLYYTTGKKIDSLVIVYATYKCIGKNGYGVEDEVESSSIVYLINNKVVDLSGLIRKDPLYIRDRAVSRTLTLYDDEGSMTIQPVMYGGSVHLVVTTDESCVEDARLRILFADESSSSYSSWNDFNCKGTSYFRISQSDLNMLSSKKISFVSFSEENTLFCSVPENEADYFMQYVALIKK